jgi:alpha-beta hydrolase superfamily lysophospholipase
LTATDPARIFSEMPLRDIPRSMVTHFLRFLGYGITGVICTLLVVGLWLGVRHIPELKPWHLAPLREEFTAADSTRVHDLAGYRELEDRLFAELQVEVYQQVAESDRQQLGRYTAGSRADGNRYPAKGNRTYELPVAAPKCGALLIHGLTDSPYSLKGIATRLHDKGCLVVGIRLPGHGTAPVALTRVHWEDWAAVVRLAARDLRGRLGTGVPLYFVGYSTGAALSVDYALAGLEGADQPRVDALVLLSPAIGVDPLAWLAPWQSRVATLPGLSKLAWLSVVPEYDPYKYNSFPVNAGQQIYELTEEIDARLGRLEATGAVRGFPRTLVFQSVADATVSPAAVIARFLARLAPGGHEVVAFDVNRLADAGPLFRPDTRAPAEHLLQGRTWPFDATLLTNASDTSMSIVALRRAAEDTVVRSEATGLSWPAGIFAMSHVSIPMPPDDPIYGATRPAGRGAIYLGRVELLGEQGLLTISPNVLVRLRFDPFFPYLWERTERFLF